MDLVTSSAISLPLALQTTLDAFAARYGLTLHGTVKTETTVLWHSPSESSVSSGTQAVKRLYSVGIAFGNGVPPLTFKTTDERFVEALRNAWLDSPKRIWIGYEDLDGKENTLLLDLRDIVAVQIS